MEYPAAFEAVWEVTGRRGHKVAALEAWKKVGKPLAEAVGAAWKAYLASLEDWRSPKDVSSWLRLRGHEQEYAPAPVAAKDARCAFHRAAGTRGKRPMAGWFADCPECKHARAGSGTRIGEPTSTRDLAAETDAILARNRRGTPATADELAQLRGKREPQPPAPRTGAALTTRGAGVTPAAPPGGSSADGAGTASGDLAGSSVPGERRRM